MAEKKTTKTVKKTDAKKTAPVKDEVVIETIDIPQDVINTEIPETIEEPEEVKDAEKIEKMVKESQERANDCMKNGSDPVEVKKQLESELEKMEELKKKVEEAIPSRYTSLWNGINFNL